MIDDSMSSVLPGVVLESIASSIPEDCRRNLIIIGSLAVGYYFFRDKHDMLVRTKDADCLLSPRIEAVDTGKKVTEQLFDAGWSFRPDARWARPGDESTPDNELPAVRLYPPGNSDWFIELLTVPESAEQRDMQWMRLKTRYGHFGLGSFGFLSLANYEQIETPLKIFVARPELMALANLLEHSVIRSQTMSAPILGSSWAAPAFKPAFIPAYTSSRRLWRISGCRWCRWGSAGRGIPVISKV